MSIQFKIQVTKDILYECRNCGTGNDITEMGSNCAIAVALRDLFPRVYVTNFHIFPFGIQNDRVQHLKIELPLVAQQFVKLFDGFRLMPRLRLLLPEFEFIIDIPDAVISAINIDEITELMEGVKTPGLISQ